MRFRKGEFREYWIIKREDSHWTLWEGPFRREREAVRSLKEIYPLNGVFRVAKSNYTLLPLPKKKKKK